LGRPEGTIYIDIESDILGVLENLREPLHYHRAYHPNRCIWADSICINQQDLTERSSQIPLMKRIYEEAIWISAWLGPSTPGTDLDIKKIEEWDAYYQGLKEIPDNNRDAVSAEIAPENELLYGPPSSPAYEGWSTIQELCKRSWWSRA
jgi:Heterokaryon incompatibility protein (HET)